MRPQGALSTVAVRRQLEEAGPGPRARARAPGRAGGSLRILADDPPASGLVPAILTAVAIMIVMVGR